MSKERKDSDSTYRNSLFKIDICHAWVSTKRWLLLCAAGGFGGRRRAYRWVVSVKRLTVVGCNEREVVKGW